MNPSLSALCTPPPPQRRAPSYEDAGGGSPAPSPPPRSYPPAQSDGLPVLCPLRLIHCNRYVRPLRNEPRGTALLTLVYSSFARGDRLRNCRWVYKQCTPMCTLSSSHHSKPLPVTHQLSHRTADGRNTVAECEHETRKLS